MEKMKEIIHKYRGKDRKRKTFLFIPPKYLDVYTSNHGHADPRAQYLQSNWQRTDKYKRKLRSLECLHSVHLNVVSSSLMLHCAWQWAPCLQISSRFAKVNTDDLLLDELPSVSIIKLRKLNIILRFYIIYIHSIQNVFLSQSQISFSSPEELDPLSLYHSCTDRHNWSKTNWAAYRGRWLGHSLMQSLFQKLVAL